MSKKIKTDFNKPYYINSYNADEVIFHMIRGTSLKTGNYDASFPVSLESLKIKELCAGKEISREFPSVFHVVGNGDNYKTYSDAVINIKFSNQGELLKWQNGAQNRGVLAIDQIRKDYESFCKEGIDFETLIGDKEADGEICGENLMLRHTDRECAHNTNDRSIDTNLSTMRIENAECLRNISKELI